MASQRECLLTRFREIEGSKGLVHSEPGSRSLETRQSRHNLTAVSAHLVYRACSVEAFLPSLSNVQGFCTWYAHLLVYLPGMVCKQDSSSILGGRGLFERFALSQPRVSFTNASVETLLRLEPTLRLKI